MSSVKEKPVIPGEKVAVIEEFEGGAGTYSTGEVVRSTKLGKTQPDLVRRRLEVKPVKVRTKMPIPGDEVVGQAETVQGSIVNIRIHYLNGEPNNRGFTGMILLPQEPAMGRVRRRRVIYCKPGDLLRAKVVSNENAIIHLTLDGSDNGVIYAACSICGARLVRMGEGLKCTECGNQEDRKLAADFGSTQIR